MEKSLIGKRALITGSFQGIGLAIAEALAAQGATIVLHGLADQRTIAVACQAIKAIAGYQPEYYQNDLADGEQASGLIGRVHENGNLDILVNNAGIQHTAPLAVMPSEIWQRIIAINLSAAFYTMQAAMPSMAERGYGRVINIASVHALVASINKAPYVAAKFALVGLAKVAALEYANAGTRESGGVTVNCLCPGWTDTPILQPQINARAEKFAGDCAAAIQDLVTEKQPSGRMSRPQEIGDLAAWLCHPIAHNITGAAIPVDGGWTSQ